ncbi:hypothetical protein PR048_032847 [Dryococelus australis]|uniref:Uncharacterized protein n=1 Tax=Dryococelus australis TaxID=614101 RepID=A0ABQ9G3E1_9NEOP|nr:hypothetical protein PR048_032847 [Dryococelus australis]
MSTAASQITFSTLHKLKSYLRNSTLGTKQYGFTLLRLHRKKIPSADSILDNMAENPRRIDIMRHWVWYLASHQGKLAALPGGDTPAFSHVGNLARLVGGFFRGSPVSPALALLRCSMPPSLCQHHLSRPRFLSATQISPFHSCCSCFNQSTLHSDEAVVILYLVGGVSGRIQNEYPNKTKPQTKDEVGRFPFSVCVANIHSHIASTAVESRVWNSAGMQGGGKHVIPEETRQPTASSAAIPTCDNTEVTWPVI